MRPRAAAKSHLILRFAQGAARASAGGSTCARLAHASRLAPRLVRADLVTPRSRESRHLRAARDGREPPTSAPRSTRGPPRTGIGGCGSHARALAVRFTRTGIGGCGSRGRALAGVARAQALAGAARAHRQRRMRFARSGIRGCCARGRALARAARALALAGAARAQALVGAARAQALAMRLARGHWPLRFLRTGMGHAGVAGYSVAALSGWLRAASKSGADQWFERLGLLIERCSDCVTGLAPTEPERCQRAHRIAIHRAVRRS